MKLPLVVIPGDTPSLLVRNWLKKLKLDWMQVFEQFQVEKQDGSPPEELEEVFEKHKAVFGGLRKLKDCKVSIELKEGKKPRYFKGAICSTEAYEKGT